MPAPTLLQIAILALLPALAHPAIEGTPQADVMKDARPRDKKPEAGNIIAGTFTGIEQGDYAHWNMRTGAGGDRSFFILQPEASVEQVLRNPKAFVGRPCRVTWKTSTENLPEAGGKMKIEQILSVEWIAEK